MSTLPPMAQNEVFALSAATAAVPPTPKTSSAIWPPFMIGQPDCPVRVILVDNDPHIRRVISQELFEDLRINLVGQAATFRDGKRLIDSNEFDVLLVDLDLGDATGFQLIEYLKSVHPSVEVVVVSASEDEEAALKAFQLGATGYMIKTSWFGSFSEAVLQVVNGGASISPSLARRLLDRLQSPGALVLGAAASAAPKAESTSSGRDRLSEREQEILKLLAVGYTSGEIGTRLLISFQTVNSHIRTIYAKLSVHTRAEAINYATTHGLLD